MSPPRFTAWSPSRLDDYLTCPFKAMHKHLLKTCPLCFKGKITGGFDKPAICDTCGKVIEKSPALERGTEIGDALDAYLTGKTKQPGKTIRHPAVLEVVKKAKAEVKKGIGFVQVNLQLTKDWKIFTGPGWSPQIWLRAKLDYQRVTGALAHVIDWKTGGIDKQTGAVRASEKYDDQLMLYNVATLCARPEVEGVTSQLVFLDCGTPHNPEVNRDGLARKDLEKIKKKFVKKVLPMLTDDTFAPRANGTCRFCEYRKDVGGPCPF